MRIALIDETPWDYTPDTPYQRPLGGSQSALCYLAEELARDQQVCLFNRTVLETSVRGVRVIPLATVTGEQWRSLDVAVVLNSAKLGQSIRPLLRAEAPLVLWTQHAHDQPAVQPIGRPDVAASWDGVAFVSRWQQSCYGERFGIDLQQTAVLRNAISPAFADLPSDLEQLLAGKSGPPTLAYTSTPFRGLDVLLDLVGLIREHEPEARLRVYSSMQVYQHDAQADAARHGMLYERCRQTPGVDYIGSLPQPLLASALASAHVLAYPNHFAETSCIAVLEALAAGCTVVTSDWGALPETCAGYGRLVPIAAARSAASDGAPRGAALLDEAYRQAFVRSTVQALSAWRRDPASAARRVHVQAESIRGNFRWAVLAAEWKSWLAALVGQRSRLISASPNVLAG